MSTTNRYDKLFISLKYYLLGRKYYTALKALEFSRKLYGTEMRKDGITPSFQHPVEIALYLTTLKDIENEELCLIAALTHDNVEDQTTRENIEVHFGKEVERIVWLLTKEYQGSKKDTKQYFEDIANDPVASIVKASDRIHNFNSMVGVFSKKKQEEYLEEVETYFLPMIKKAKNNFPTQTQAYMNAQHMLKSQINFVKAILGK